MQTWQVPPSLGNVRKSADLETEEGRKSYTCSRVIFHYHTIIRTALIGVMHPQPINVQAEDLKNRIDFCMQIVLS